MFSKNGGEYINYLDGDKPLPKTFVIDLKEKARLIGYPLFLRTDQLSGKHSWGEWLPYVTNEETLVQKIYPFFEESINAGWGGVPLFAFVLREFLELDYKFKAFGGMPIARERRYFIRDGKIACHHPYWPLEAIQFYGDVKEPVGWQDQLRELNVEAPEEVALLSSYATKVAKVLKGYWSVDFAHAKDGVWHLIDMALGDESWHPACKNKVTNDPTGS
jgi:hypothetical protein